MTIHQKCIYLHRFITTNIFFQFGFVTYVHLCNRGDVAIWTPTKHTPPCISATFNGLWLPKVPYSLYLETDDLRFLSFFLFYFILFFFACVNWACIKTTNRPKCLCRRPGRKPAAAACVSACWFDSSSRRLLGSVAGWRDCCDIREAAAPPPPGDPGYGAPRRDGTSPVPGESGSGAHFKIQLRGDSPERGGCSALKLPTEDKMFNNLRSSCS